VWPVNHPVRYRTVDSTEKWVRCLCGHRAMLFDGNLTRWNIGNT